MKRKQKKELLHDMDCCMTNRQHPVQKGMRCLGSSAVNPVHYFRRPSLHSVHLLPQAEVMLPLLRIRQQAAARDQGRG